MSGFSTWTRKLGGIIAVWLMATLVLGPALDTFICKDEAEPAAAASVMAAGEVAVSADHGKAEPGHGGPAVCAHGHCHHSLNLGLVAAVATVAPAAVTEPHDLSESALYASRFPSGLDRPPRA